MNPGLTNDALALLAGVLSTLSPCVLPLIPVIAAGATATHRRGLGALALGLVVSFAGIGTTLAFAATALDFDPAIFRTGAAIVLGLLGVLLLSASWQRRYAVVTSSAGDWGQRLLARFEPTGLSGQFVVGLMLGVIWSPCAGPTLGAAIGLATQGRDLSRIAVTMGAFAVGAVLPLLGIGALSRTALSRVRVDLLAGGRIGKAVLGTILLLTAVGMLGGIDQRMETWLAIREPAWLASWSARF